MHKSVSSRINDLISFFAPRLALDREVALSKRSLLVASGHYNGASKGARAKDFRRNRTDAIEASRHDRSSLSFINRDMLRNNPRVVKGRRQLRNNVVGAGIIPAVKLRGDPDEKLQALLEGLIDRHCMTINFDADGVQSMLGQQGLAFSTIVGDGEVLLRRRMRRPVDGFPLNFQVQVLETDFLNEQVDGPLQNGNFAVQGIEFDAIGRRVAYHLFERHPGSRMGALPASRRILADHIIHAYDVQRPGQVRGVSWFAPVVTLLHELQKYQDGQIKRQEIAALYAAILKTDEPSEEIASDMRELSAGSVMVLGNDEDMAFHNPPGVEGYEPFMRVTDRVIAAGLGITYESYAGDYSSVNYTSGRMGRMDTEPNTQDWQKNIMIAQVCNRLSDWIKEGVFDVAGVSSDAWDIMWTPPMRPVVDPTKDYKADAIAVDALQVSRREVIRRRGGDPAKVEAEILQERLWQRENLSNASEDSASAQEKDD